MPRSRTERRATSAFTLIELVIVIAVIAILAALLVPTILGQAERARASRAIADVKVLSKAIGIMRTDTGSSTAACLTNLALLFANASPAVCNPATAAALTICSTTDPASYCWGGPYIREIVPDPWGNAYYASEDLVTFDVTVTSNGPDGVGSTSDDVSFTY